MSSANYPAVVNKPASCQGPQPIAHQSAHANPKPHPITAEFDESIFDDSMTISEEDLIYVEKSANESDLNVYPLLPLKRK